MKFFLSTFGCQMNLADSERISSYLKDLDYQPASTYSEADLVVVNMCSVRQSAVDRIFGLINNINKLKNPPTTILTGCFVKPDQEKFKEKFDFVVSKENLFSTLDKIAENPDSNLLFWDVKPDYKSNFEAFVPTMKGCDEYCTYCIVPYTRGLVEYRSANQILKQVQEAVNQNYKSVWLVGQTVNNYKGKIDSVSLDFAKLLQKVASLEGDFWLSFTSPHPKYFSNELIEVMAKNNKIRPYLNLPLQSGDDEILKKMNRSYTFQEYKKIIEKVRQSFNKYRSGLEKDLTLSTDIIVGFPGETKEQFQNTARALKDISYDMVYTARYSPRPLTAATSFEDNVSYEEKKQREKELTKIFKKTSYQHNKKYLDKTIPVLIKEFDPERKLLFGKSRSFKTVKIKNAEKDLTGQIASVKINKIDNLGLQGQINE